MYGWDDFCMLMFFGMCCWGYLLMVIWIFCNKVGMIKWENLIDFNLFEFCVCDELNKIVL